MGGHLPGEAHAAVDLDALSCRWRWPPRPPGAWPPRPPIGVPDLGLVDGDRGGVDGAPGQLGPHRHVGAQVLDGLEPADGTTELRRCLAYSTASSVVQAAAPTCRRGGQHRAVPPPPVGDLRPGHRVALGEGRPPPTPGSADPSAGPAGWRPPNAGPRRRRPSSASTSSTSRSSRYSTMRGSAARRWPTGPSTRPTTTAVIGPLDQSGGQMGGHQGTGHQRPPELLEDQAASASPSPTPPASSARHRSNTPASASWRQPARSTTRSANSNERTRSSGKLPCAQPAHPLGQVGLQLGQLEVHGRRSGLRRGGDPGLRLGGDARRRGDQRLLGQAEDPLAHDVALDLRRAGGDGQRDAPQPVLHHGPGRERSPAVHARRRRRRPGRPGPAGRARTPRACARVSE